MRKPARFTGDRRQTSTPDRDRRDVLVRRLADGRGRRVVFLSHCLLNENVRYLGGATRPGAVLELVEPYLQAGLGIVQMPCPEQHAWGGVLKPRMLRIYGSRLLRYSPLRRAAVVAARAYTAFRYRGLARRVARDMVDNARGGIDVVELVGVGASPSCGVSTTLDLDHAIAAMACTRPCAVTRDGVNQGVVGANVVCGAGLFIRELQGQLDRAGLAVSMREHDLIGELAAR